MTGEDDLPEPGGLVESRPDRGGPAQKLRLPPGIPIEPVEVRPPQMPGLRGRLLEVGKRDAYFDRPTKILVARLLHRAIHLEKVRSSLNLDLSLSA